MRERVSVCVRVFGGRGCGGSVGCWCGWPVGSGIQASGIAPSKSSGGVEDFPSGALDLDYSLGVRWVTPTRAEARRDGRIVVEGVTIWREICLKIVEKGGCGGNT